MKNHSLLTRRDFVKNSLAGAVVIGVAGNAAAGQILVGSPANHRRNSITGTKPDPRSIFRSDLSLSQPGTSLTREHEPGKWLLADYETEEGVKGVMVYAKPEEDCGELIIPLNAEGIHKIYLGIHYPKTKYPRFHDAELEGGLEAKPYWPHSIYGQIEVKLSDDTGFKRVAAEIEQVDEVGERTFPSRGAPMYKSVQDIYWKTADLNGQSLILRQPQDPYRWPCWSDEANLTYIRIVPLNNDEIQEWEALQPTRDSKRIALIYSTGQFSTHTDGRPGRNYHPTSEQWFVDDFEAYKNTDVGVFVFEAHRGAYSIYNSKIGHVGSHDNRWHDDWVDPLAAYTKLAHENGMKIFASLRMIGALYPNINSPLARAQQHIRLNPQWLKRDAEGKPLSNISIAYPEVRRFWLSLLRETLEYGIDGVQLHLCRSAPFVLYEDIVVREFQEKYGEDPRIVDERDPRWIAHHQGYLTQFVREVRALVDEKPNRYLGVTVYGPERPDFDPQDPGRTDRPGDDYFIYNSHFSDVETWLKERLVDYVMPTEFIELDVLRKWRRLGGDRVHIWPDLMPRYQTPAAYARLAAIYRDNGADGYCLWDGERRHGYLNGWAALSRMGHMNQLDKIGEMSAGRTVDLKALGGFPVKSSFRDG